MHDLTVMGRYKIVMYVLGNISEGVGVGELSWILLLSPPPPTHPPTLSMKL